MYLEGFSLCRKSFTIVFLFSVISFLFSLHHK